MAVSEPSQMARAKNSKGKPREVSDGMRSIHYSVIHSRRKTVGIQVKRDATVIVRAPFGLPGERLDEIILSRAKWIEEHQRRFEAEAANRPSVRDYAEGGCFPFLGKTYTLHVIEEPTDGVRLFDDQIIVSTAGTTRPHRLQAMIDIWYRQQAEVIFNECLARWTPRATALGIPSPARLTIRTMTSRWGSCSSRRRITLNLRLIEHTPDLIDYVVVHELCHLQVMNHSPAFYAFMERLMPDWKRRQKALRQLAASID